MKYPKREKFYAHRLTRLLFKSCAAQSIGQDAVLLVIHIAHTEDAARYQGPVRFWNSQLNEVLGFRSPKSLNNARHKAIQAGWLVYERPNDRADGRYWTEIPSHVALFDDEPIEPVSIPSTEQEREQEPSYLGRNGNGKRNRKVTGNDPLPNPVPVPINTVARASAAQVEDFQKLWDLYPSRNGRKLEKSKALDEFQKLKTADIPLVMLAVAELAKSDQLPKDCFRWLRGGSWREWLPTKPESKQSVKPKLAGKGKPLFDEVPA